jgi:hypothetical protein
MAQYSQYMNNNYLLNPAVVVLGFKLKKTPRPACPRPFWQANGRARVSSLVLLRLRAGYPAAHLVVLPVQVHFLRIRVGIPEGIEGFEVGT